MSHDFEPAEQKIFDPKSEPPATSDLLKVFSRIAVPSVLTNLMGFLTPVVNSVIAGHRDTHFSFLRDIEMGDMLVIERFSGRKHLYKVIGIDVVDSRRGSLLLDTDVSILSLVTCYPFDADEAGGPLRYVVTARQIY